jgi:hypothetical protein
VDNKEQDTLRFTFNETTDHLGFSAVERTHLLNGKSADDSGAFTKANIGPVTEALAQIDIALSLMFDDDSGSRAFVRAKDLPGFEGDSIAECILSRSSERMTRAIRAMEAKLKLS